MDFKIIYVIDHARVLYIIFDNVKLGKHTQYVRTYIHYIHTYIHTDIHTYTHRIP